MSTKMKKTTAVNPEENETAAVVQEPETNLESASETDTAEKAREQKEKMEKFFAKLPDPCVYCGPSVRNVTRQYTVYTGGLPDVLKEFIIRHPAARGLLVSAERFADVRKRLETPGTGEYILFGKVRAELTE